MKPAGPTKRGLDPLAELLAKLRSAGSALRELFRKFLDVFSFAPVFIYFWLYWTPKEFIRTWLRVGALGFLSVSLLLLWLEVAAEIAKEHMLSTILPASEKVRWGILGAFSASVLALLWHHHQERKHRHSEFLLAERVWEFMMTRGTLSRDECLSTALRLFSDVFVRFGIRHVSVAFPAGKQLTINPAHVHPQEDANSYFQPLPEDSVAGLVFSDYQPRYVPRLFFPWNGQKRRPLCVFFPHALMFEIRKGDTGRVDVVRPKIDLDAFKTSDEREFPFKSFVTAPLKPVNRRDAIGVINFDFSSTDPLSRIDVKMAVLLGLILADELERLTPQTPPALKAV